MPDGFKFSRMSTRQRRRNERGVDRNQARMVRRMQAERQLAGISERIATLTHRAAVASLPQMQRAVGAKSELSGPALRAAFKAAKAKRRRMSRASK